MTIPHRLQQGNQALRVIKRVSRAIQQLRSDRRRLLKEVCDIIIEERGYETIWIGEFRHDDLYPSISCGNVGEQSQQMETWITQAPFNQAAAEQAIQQKKAVISKQDRSRLRSTYASPWITAAVPIFAHDEITAILNACTYNESAFDEQELQLLEELAIDVGFALESMELDNRRREAEDALRISEGRFRRLSENSLVGIVLIQNDLVRYANPAVSQMFGYASPEEIIDKLDPLDLIAEEHQTLVAESIRDNLRGTRRVIRLTLKGLRENGTTFDIEFHGGRTIHARRAAVLATILDITEREQSRHQLEALSKAGLALSRVRTPQEALQRAVEQALSIVPGDASNIYLIEEDILRRVADAGYSPSETNSRPRTNFEMIPTFQQMLQTRAPLLINDTANSELWDPNPKHRTVRAYLGTPLIVRGEIIGFLNVDSWQAGRFAHEDAQHVQRFADYVAATIEHLRLIASLEAEQQRLTLLNQLSQTLSETLEPEKVAERALEKIGDALGAQQGLVYLWDAETETPQVLSGQGIDKTFITFLNQKLKNNRNSVIHWVSRQREGVLIPDVKQDIRWLLIPGANDWVNTALDVPLEVHGELVGVLSLLSADTEAFSEHDKRLVEALSIPVALALQNARFYHTAAHQARVLEEALRRQAELDQMKDEMIQNISHELRTPLALVMGYAVMLQDGALGSINPEQTEAIDIIARRSQMLRTLVENITLLWQIESGQQDKAEPEAINLCQLAQTVVDEFRHQSQQKQITLKAHGPEYPLFVNGVPLQIHRILDNLIGNALKFTPEGGNINIEVSQQDDIVLLSVSDTGIGIPQEKLDKVFERFYQVDGSSKRRYGGTGLGLALIKAIAETHGGSVSAHSPMRQDTVHPGTQIVVQLPLWKSE